jgi:8-oxo-dGTP pyrophosphatase MutT (NUDIX family)
MQLNEETLTSSIKDAASLVLLRDRRQALADHTLEVFLLQRHAASQVLGGAYVFAGGKLDPQDLSAQNRGLIDQTHEALMAQLGESDLPERTAAGLFVAALREAYEECGVLWVKDPTLRLSVPELTERKKEFRHLTHSGLDFLSALERLNLQLDTQALAPWSRWITPPRPTVSTQRFDARFFLGLLPDQEVATHDQRETTHSVWLTPQKALEAYVQGQMELAAPQIMCLLQLKPFTTARAVLDAAKKTSPLRVEPKSLELNGQRGVCFPGDEFHPEKQKALLGPTRLWFSDGQFKPESGLDSLLFNH